MRAMVAGASSAVVRRDPGTVEPDIVEHHGDHWLAIGNHRDDCVF